MVEEGKGGINGDGRRQLGVINIPHNIQKIYYNCIPKNYMILLTNVTSINSIKKHDIKKEKIPWLVWLSVLSASLQTKGLPV